MVKKIDVERLENIIKMFSVIKVELAYALPPEDLGPHLRGISGCVATLRNLIRLESQDAPPSNSN